MTASEQPRGFHVAPFALDGELIETAYWPLEKLSPRWVEACGRFLTENGASFLSAWAPPLAHIETRFSSDRGAALATFYVEQRVTAVCALASGAHAAADSEVLEKFVASLRHLRAVKAAAASCDPFGRARSLPERPLLALCTRGDPFISAADEALARELTRHVAAAYFSATRRAR